MGTNAKNGITFDGEIKEVIKSSFEKAAGDLGLTLKEFMQQAPRQYLDLLALSALREYTDPDLHAFDKAIEIVNFKRGKHLWEK